MYVFLVHSFPRIFSNLVQTACCMYFKTDIQNYTSYKLQSLAFLAVSELKLNFSFEVYTYFWLCCSELAGLPCSFMIHTYQNSLLVQWLVKSGWSGKFVSQTNTMQRSMTGQIFTTVWPISLNQSLPKNSCLLYTVNKTKIIYTKYCKH